MPFKRRVFKNYSHIGALSRSSKFLCKKMLHTVDFSKDIHIVEFGPGDGIFTDEIIKKLSPNSKISIFEIDEGFCNFLKKKYKNTPQVEIYEKNAQEIKNIFSHESIDYIISSLPLAFIDKKIVDDILRKSNHILKNNGKFIQYQYFLQNKKQITTHFPKIEYKFTLFNIPPAFVYICHK